MSYPGIRALSDIIYLDEAQEHKKWRRTADEMMDFIQMLDVLSHAIEDPSHQELDVLNSPRVVRYMR